MRLLAAPLVALTAMLGTAASAEVRPVRGFTFTADYVSSLEDGTSDGIVTFTSGVLTNACDITNCETTSGTFGIRSDTIGGSLNADLSQSYRSMIIFFGNDDPCCAGPFDVRLSVFSGNTALGSVSATANMNDRVDQFIGLTSDTPWDRFEVDYGGAPVYVFVDDLLMGSYGEIPEPASWAMMIAGLGLAGAAVRRRRTQALRHSVES